MGWIFRLCMMNMKRRKARTILTILGVTIGVISVVALIGLSMGVKKELLSQYADEGDVCRIEVQPADYGKQKHNYITSRTIQKMQKIDKVAKVYPKQEAYLDISVGKYEYWGSVIGLPKEELASIAMIEGSSLQEKGQKPELIVGNHIGETFMNINTYETYEDGTGKKAESFLNMDLNYVSGETKGKLHVSAVVAGGESYNSYSFGIYCDIDTLIRYIKTSAPQLMEPKDEENAQQTWCYSGATVIVKSIDDVEFVMKKLSDLGFQVTNGKEELQKAQKEIKLIQFFLIGIGGIALIVAVIGISNTMTTAVYDRVNEIGILKVLGCDMDELRFLFLFEAGVIGLFGGVCGVGLCCILKGLINRFVILTFAFPPGTQLVIIPAWLSISAIVSSAILAVLAGYIPARWASKLSPLSAVRHS